MSTVTATRAQRLVLYDVPWERYGRLLRAFDDRHLRLTYDQGTLEIMTLSHKHESYKHLLGALLLVVAEELNVENHAGGSVPFQREDLERGLEPDEC